MQPNLAATVGGLSAPDEILAARIALGLTQEQFADVLEARPDTVRAWEKGRRPVPGPARVALRLLLGLQKPPKLKSA